MEGLLARWALALQEYDFTIAYRKGTQNGNADALSRRSTPLVNAVAITTLYPSFLSDVQQHQENDPTMQLIRSTLSSAHPKPQGSKWSRSPLQRYRQLWPQLSLVDGIVYRCYAPGPTTDQVTVPIIPTSLRKEVLRQLHDSPSAGHLGADKTLGRVRQVGYWVNMIADVEAYCRECLACQAAKPPSPQRIPLKSVPIGNPWQMVAVDTLEVPRSPKNNRYLLVVQDYFTKWVEAIPLPDQTAGRITDALTKIFTTLGFPEILHSDQGRNFESTILRQTLEAFGVQKSRTTAYHPQGDGMVERFNRSLLQMLRTYVRAESDWEPYLPLMLFAYRTAIHSSTGVSPFELMFGRPSCISDLPSNNAFDAGSYPLCLRSKLAKLQDIVEPNVAQASHRQKSSYDRSTHPHQFQVDDPVWLSIPTAGKLDPRWEGRWKIQSIKGAGIYKISDGTRA